MTGQEREEAAGGTSWISSGVCFDSIYQNIVLRNSAFFGFLKKSKNNVMLVTPAGARGSSRGHARPAPPPLRHGERKGKTDTGCGCKGRARRERRSKRGKKTRKEWEEEFESTFGMRLLFSLTGQEREEAAGGTLVPPLRLVIAYRPMTTSNKGLRKSSPRESSLLTTYWLQSI